MIHNVSYQDNKMNLFVEELILEQADPVKKALYNIRFQDRL